jgi:hypothetical protein
MLLLPGAIAGLIGLHLYLVVRLGVSSPPWSKEAAGSGPLDGDGASSNGKRSGLVKPAARGNRGR